MFKGKKCLYVSVTNTGSGNNVLATSPQIATPTLTGDVQMTTGNLVIGTAGKGIDFSASSSLAGMTSQLLDDYEEGTWSSGSITGGNCSSVSLSNATYTKIGRVMTLNGKFSATLTTTATETYVFFNLPIDMMSNAYSATGIVAHTLSTAFPGIGVVIDTSGGEASSVVLEIPSTQVDKANGSAFTAVFTFVYESD